jgi:hypothetical protein
VLPSRKHSCKKIGLIRRDMISKLEGCKPAPSLQRSLTRGRPGKRSTDEQGAHKVKERLTLDPVLFSWLLKAEGKLIDNEYLSGIVYWSARRGLLVRRRRQGNAMVTKQVEVISNTGRCRQIDLKPICTLVHDGASLQPQTSYP